MPRIILEPKTDPWYRRLLIPAYSVSDAARYADISPQTVSNWHYRETKSGITLPGKERQKPLSYLELIEVAVVAVFRNYGVPLQNIRKTRQYFSQNFSVEYPFATYKFKTDGYHLLMELQQFEPIMDLKKLIVADKGGQLGWKKLMKDKLFEFDYENELAVKWHVAGRKSSVLIDPRIAFGAPMVQGLPTWVLRGRYIAGETMAEINQEFGIPIEAIKDGLRFEGVKLSGGSVLG